VITTRELVFLSAAALLGWLGGAVSAGRPVHAQERNLPKVITAEKFVVVDTAGTRRAEIGVGADGQASVRIYDERGKLEWSAPESPHVWPATAPARR